MFHVRTPLQFEEDLKFFQSIGRAVSMSELVDITLNGVKIEDPVFHITFDDGLREYCDFALPILKRYKVPSSVFVNTEFVDNRDLFYRFKVALILNRSKQSHETRTRLMEATHKDLDWIASVAEGSGIDFSAYLSKSRPYLTSVELQTLASENFSIGSHSCDHKWFKFLSEDEMKDQVTRSFAWLKGRYSNEVNTFSFPFSDEGVPKSFLQWLHNSYGCQLSFGISGLKSDVAPNHLHRIPMENSLEPASKIIVREYLKCVARIPLGKNTIKRS